MPINRFVVELVVQTDPDDFAPTEDDIRNAIEDIILPYWPRDLGEVTLEIVEQRDYDTSQRSWETR